MLCKERYQEDPVEEMVESMQRADWSSSTSRKEEEEQVFDRPQAWTPEGIQQVTRQMGRQNAEESRRTPVPVRKSAKNTTIQAPLRTVPISTPSGVENRLMYIPFTIVDLVNWQE